MKFNLKTDEDAKRVMVALIGEGVPRITLMEYEHGGYAWAVLVPAKYAGKLMQYIQDNINE